MIVFFVCDNSGVKYIKVLNFLKGLKAQFSVGSFYNVLSKTFFRQSKVKKGLFYNGLLIRFAG
jgi:ribosomal protein L14